MQGLGDYEGAARHAFFAGHMEKAMQCLRSCKGGSGLLFSLRTFSLKAFVADERLRVLAPVLAAYVRRLRLHLKRLADLSRLWQLAQKATAIGSDSVYADLCRSLSSDCETPWIRGRFFGLVRGGRGADFALSQRCSRSWPVEIGERLGTRLDFLSRTASLWR